MLDLATTYVCLLMACPLALPLIGLSGYLVWKAWRGGWTKAGPNLWVACTAMTAIGVALLLQPIGWHLRLDRDGVRLTAPLDVMDRGGVIAWSDLDTIRFGNSGRSNSPVLIFRSKSTATLVLQSLDGVPEAWWPAMVAAVQANRPDFPFTPSPAEWLAEARAVSKPNSGALMGWRYAMSP